LSSRYFADKTFIYLNENKLLKEKKEIFYVFDLHNVLDLLDHNFKIKRINNKKMAACYHIIFNI